MKTLLLSMFDGLFAIEPKESPGQSTAKIFMTSTDVISGRTLIIEEHKYAIWAYMLNPSKEEIDFDGFLCTVANPSRLSINQVESNKNLGPLPIALANRYSCVKNLEKKDIIIHWNNDSVEILVKNKIYLVMDVNTKTSYSKGLSKDCIYGKRLENNKPN